MRGLQFEIWKNAPQPMVTLVKRLDVTRLVKASRKRGMKFNMLMGFCVGKAAVATKEFYLLPVGDKLYRYDQIAVNTIVKNRTGEVSSCDILFTDDIEVYNRDYQRFTDEVAQSCVDRDLSDDCMVVGTSVIIDTEIEAAGGMYSGIFNNPFVVRGRYSKCCFRYCLSLSFMFHHTQMGGAHAGAFLARLQAEIDKF